MWLCYEDRLFADDSGVLKGSSLSNVSSSSSRMFGRGLRRVGGARSSSMLWSSSG